MKTDSLYIHIPFCDHICSYCDFAKVFYKEDVANQYLRRLAKELAGIKRQVMKTIYIGGGTPSALTYEQLEYLLKRVERFVGKRTKEFTVEVNPESATIDKLELLKKYHVNRLSIGVQSFQDHLLHMIGRKHYSYQAIEVIENAYKLGFENISIDMMYGLPMQQEEDLMHDLERIFELPINHISYYSLILEEGTILNYKHYQPLYDETDKRWNDIIDDRLHKMGFHKYEVSNYAKGEHESFHNKAYWHYHNYLGVGIGATSKIDDKIISHSRNMTKYLNGENIEQIETQTSEDTMFNHLMMSLRLVDGLDLEDFYQRYQKHVEDVFGHQLQKHLDKGDLVIEDHHLRTTPASIAYLNDILVDFLPE
ncbi:MAG TPA: coproporphyrinogen III oxidase [Erysipelotrichaceae bacterium]|nr:coproporphyrinogen III oxidase [Erysipelotrichaceae bacterium]